MKMPCYTKPSAFPLSTKLVILSRQVSDYFYFPEIHIDLISVSFQSLCNGPSIVLA